MAKGRGEEEGGEREGKAEEKRGVRLRGERSVKGGKDVLGRGIGGGTLE